MHFATEVINQTTAEDRRALCRVGDLLMKSSDKKRRSDLYKFSVECHTISRALCLEISDGSIRYIDGNYVGIEFSKPDIVRHYHHAHTWLVTKSGAIIDPYPPGRVSIGPNLIATRGWLAPFAGNLYRPDDSIRDKLDMRDVWRRARVLRRLFHEN